QVLLSASLLLWAAPAMSQSFYGSVLSVIKDAQGGIVPGATVVLTNVATSERREGVSADDGTLQFVNLVPGTYRLEVELTGFQRFVREGIQVNVQASPRIEVTLQLGNLAETLTVIGASPLLQTLSPDAVEEFRVQTNNSSGEFGRFTGGVVNMASRSGTNSFRGSVFEYHRNKALNSNTFFGQRAGLDKPPFVQNNFGGSLGGPVFKNKLFFFSSYEGYRNREGVLFRRTVPTAAMKIGDFSDYRNLATGAVVPIYDPWTQCGIVNAGSGAYNGDCGTVPNRLQFPGNVIPANRISPVARKYLDFPVFADPTVPGRWRTENFERNASVGGDNDQLNFRGDYNVSQEHRLLGRYTRFESTNLPVDLYGNGQRHGDPYS